MLSEISSLAVLAVLLVWVWRVYQFNTVRFIERRAAILRETSRVREIEETRFLGLLSIKISIPVGAEREKIRRARGGIEVPTFATQGSVPILSAGVPPGEDDGILFRKFLENFIKHQLPILIPRLKDWQFRVPGYLHLTYPNGREELFAIKPFTATGPGIWYFAKTEGIEDGSRVKAKSRKPSMRPLRFWDFLPTGELVGVLTGHRLMRKKSGGKHCLESGGHVVSFQVLDGTPVEFGDIIFFYAVKIENLPEFANL